MSRVHLIGLLLFLSFNLGAQSELKQLLRYGDELYAKGDFYYAKQYYEQALEIDSQTLSIQWQYAQILHAYQDYRGAAEFYGKVYKKDDDYFYPYCGLYYAQMLRQSGNTADAKDVLERVVQKNAKDKKTELYVLANQELLACNWSMNNSPIDTTLAVEQLPEPVNSKHAEFPHTFIGGRLLFSSLRTDSIRGNEEVYSTNYRSQIFQFDTLKENEVLVLNDLKNSAYHIGNGTFSVDSARYYFSMCSDSKPPYSCKIYVARYSNGVYSSIDELGDVVNAPNSANTQPAIGVLNSEEVLFFVSNREDGKGGMDLYYSTIKNGNQYAQPKAVKAVNSIGDQITPFFDVENNKLYFSSNFHTGYGGFDILSSLWNGTSFAEPINLGLPINSSENDTYYIVQGKDAYFASNRMGSMYAENPTCCSDIYKASKIEVLEIDDEPYDIPMPQPEEIVNLPVLYFHNDIPNARSWSKTTNMDYQSTYDDYLNLREEYVRAWSKDKSDSTNTADDVAHLYEDFIEQGMHDLDVFRVWLLERLKEGAQLEVVVRGFASPLTYTDYNVNLAMRRIQSLINHLERFDNGVFLPYLDGTAKNAARLTFVAAPFGEYAADQTVSANRLDMQNSVYAPRAALERRIEVQAVRFLNQPDSMSVLSIENPAIDLGINKQEESISFEIQLLNRFEEPLEIERIEVPCDCTVIESKEYLIQPGQKLELMGIYETRNIIGHRIVPITIHLKSGQHFVVYLAVEVRP